MPTPDEARVSSPFSIPSVFYCCSFLRTPSFNPNFSFLPPRHHHAPYLLTASGVELLRASDPLLCHFAAFSTWVSYIHSYLVLASLHSPSSGTRSHLSPQLVCEPRQSLLPSKPPRSIVEAKHKSRVATTEQAWGPPLYSSLSTSPVVRLDRLLRFFTPSTTRLGFDNLGGP